MANCSHFWWINHIALPVTLYFVLLASTTCVFAVRLSGRREADFERKIPSISVPQGSEAHMKCTVKNLDDHEVSWIHVDKQLILSKQEMVRTNNPRIRVRRENSTFVLIIEKASLEDIGYYACKINSHPPKSQVGFLDVLVPPYFLDTNLSGDSELVVREHESVSLSCRAVANPPPKVTWRREDGQDILSFNSNADEQITGDILHLGQVTRWQSGAFICTVTSGVSAPISRRINLVVQFPPMIKVPSQASTFHTGQNGLLECVSESYPPGQLEWSNPRGQRIIESSKYSLREERTFLFRVIHKVTVRQVAHSDAGRYTCSITNSLGTTNSKLNLYVIDRWKQALNSTNFSTTSTSGLMFPSSTPFTPSMVTYLYEVKANQMKDRSKSISKTSTVTNSNGISPSKGGHHKSTSTTTATGTRSLVTSASQGASLSIKLKNIQQIMLIISFTALIWTQTQ